jgi:lambda repressor-like predicted transcriptional regulator
VAPGFVILRGGRLGPSCIILELHQQAVTVSAIARRTGLRRSTVASAMRRSELCALQVEDVWTNALDVEISDIQFPLPHADEFESWLGHDWQP